MCLFVSVFFFIVFGANVTNAKIVGANVRPFTRLVFIFVLCDAYKAWIERVEHLPGPNGAQSLFDLEWRFYFSLIRSAAEFGAFAFALLSFRFIFGHFGKIAGNSRGIRAFIESTLVGFYGSLFVVVSIIWQLYGLFSYWLLTRIFIFLSHLQIQRTLFPGVGPGMNLLAVFVGASAQFITGIAFQHFVAIF